MKRIAIWCNGTWNRASAEHPTNVQLGAQALLSSGGDVPQLNIYLEGVGTSFLVNEWLETRLAGAFGWGLFDKIAEAYRHIVFNYEPGDEIYIFGFSRGAYTARSLAGLLRKCGIIEKANSKKIRQAFNFYKNPNIHPDSDEAQEFRMRNSPGVVLKELDRKWRTSRGFTSTDAGRLPILNVKYLGVWDTVGALGVPQHMLISKLTRTKAKYAFHDPALSSTVFAARHAVAVDETRLSFTPSLWSNLDILNGDGPSVRYLQKWFPGGHGSVGGGGDIVGLSHGAFEWVLEGAIEQGLAFDTDMLAQIGDLQDCMAPLQNQTKPPGWLDRIYRRAARKGPHRVADLSESTLLRLEAESKSYDARRYRPKTLKLIHKDGSEFRRPPDAKYPNVHSEDTTPKQQSGRG